MTLAQLADHLGAVGDDAERRWRWVMEFLEEFRHEPPGSRCALLAESPRLTGDAGWDVFIGGLAEHLAFHDDQTVPRWALTPERTWGGKVWYVSDLPSARVWAFVHSPASFRGRGIFVSPEDLQPV